MFVFDMENKYNKVFGLSNGLNLQNKIITSGKIDQKDTPPWDDIEEI